MFDIEACEREKHAAIVEQPSWNGFLMEIGPPKWIIFSTGVTKISDMMDRLHLDLSFGLAPFISKPDPLSLSLILMRL